MTTFREARDDIFTIFKTAWDTTGHKAVYPDKADEKPSDNSPWTRITLHHSTGGQGSLANHGGVRRWNRTGFIVVQIFVPVGKGLSNAYDLGKIVSDAFEGTDTPNGVWFKNVRLNEIGPDGNWFQVSVLIDFLYDEIK